MSTETIDVDAAPAAESVNTNSSLARIESGGLARAMTIDELHKNLEFIRDVMRKEMREGQDYGKIPGTGDKPTLLQPGAQKLLMTFNLTEKVKKEVLREYPGFHREYEFTITVVAGNGKEWDGVGTCSTLESKYRYRKAERRCPACGKNTIIQGKAEYGGGWVCFKKKGGCGAKFSESEPKITNQPSGEVENEDPADCWNTVRKMAFKRGLVAAAINATNTSELWTQDLEEAAENDKNRRSAENTLHQNASGRVQTGGVALDGGPPTARATAPAKPTATPPPSASAPIPPATEQTRAKMIRTLADAGLIDIATDYFRKLSDPAVLMPNESLEQVPLKFVPATLKQMRLLQEAITDFGNGANAVHAFPPNPQPETKAGKPPTETPKAVPKDDEAWRDVIVPVPNAGQKRADYIVNPDTIGSLYDQCKTGSEAACKRLFGFVNHYEAKPWKGRDGVMRPASDIDTQFREALDQFAEWDEKHGNDSQPASPPSERKTELHRDLAQEESTPFD